MLYDKQASTIFFQAGYNKRTQTTKIEVAAVAGVVII